jgi:hypothetical protein
VIDFGPAVVLGLCFGFMFGIGCSLAILYSIYLGGYRKAVEESLEPVKPKRFMQAVEKIHARRAHAAAAASAPK